MKKASLYRLEVAPLTILPLTRAPYFTYASLTPVKKGSLVSISFGKQTISGVVFECQELPGTKPSWMKYISSVIEEGSLTETQRRLAVAVSAEYFTPLGKTLKHFLPKVVLVKTKIAIPPAQKKTLLRPNKEEQGLLKKLSPTSAGIPVYLDTSLISDPKKILLLIGKHYTKAKKQTLIIVPEIMLIASLEARFRPYYHSEEIATLHSKLSPGAFFTSWERVRSGQAQVIITTRQGLFAPFLHLGAIIVTQEQDESYKQWDMSPRYHGKRVAAFLASFSGAQLILTSGTPSVESIQQIKEKKLLPLQSLRLHPPLGNALNIINLKLERYHKNFSPLSLALTQAIGETLGRGEQILLHINRQGMNAFSVCNQCKNVFRCKKCDHPLTSTKEGHFRCSSCGYTTPLFPNCPSCGHLAFRHIGFGTEKVEKEVLKLFPRARITRLDSTTFRTEKTATTLYESGMRGDIDILIGTQVILKDPPLPRLTLIAMIDADSLLLFPDFQSDERLFQNLSRAVRQVTQKKDGKFVSGKVFVQTFRPESAFFQKVATTGSEAFLKQTLAERQELFYPPFSRFISVICQGKTEKEATKKASLLFTELQDVMPKEYRLHPPYPARFLKRQALYESVLLLRLPALSVLTEKLKTILIRKSKDCIIDVDPLSIR